MAQNRVMIVDSSAPLAGIVVVSLEQAVSAPFASRQLADLGATVIKVERPGGDFARTYDADVRGMSAHFVWTNRGKQSIVLDLKDAADRATFFTLVAGADVFIHNIAPAAAQRLGVDAESLRARVPELIACAISGYGAGGPRSDDKAYDLAIQAEAGAFAVTGDEEPSRVGFAAADIAAGMYALSGILAALVRRERTGEGATIDVAMIDSLAEWLSAQLYSSHYTGIGPVRSGRRHPGIAPYGTFVTRDGRSILIAVQNDREWVSMADVFLGDAALADDPRFRTNPDRIAHVAEIEDLIAVRLAALDHDRAVALLGQAGVATADVNDLIDVWSHPQLRERQRFTLVESPVGPIEMLVAPFGVDGIGTPDRGIPDLNEHDGAVVEQVLQRGRARLP
jgi:itaconate CoA-transferase